MRGRSRVDVTNWQPGRPSQGVDVEVTKRPSSHGGTVICALQSLEMPPDPIGATAMGFVARVSSVLLLTLCCGLLAAQQPVEADPENGSISGVVVDASSGEPLGKARIFLRKPESRTQPQLTKSSPEGKFLLANIEPGRYLLSVQRNRYARQEYGRRGPNRPGTTLTLQPGQDLGGVVFRLVRAGVIVGRIINEDNEPMANVQIEAMSYRYFEGKRQLVAAGRASTDDLGEYRVFGLAAGRYRLRANFRPGFGSWGIVNIGVMLSGQPSQEYIPTYYPGAYESDQAIPIEVAPGSEILGIDIKMRPARTVRVAGTVFTRVTGRPAREAMIMLTPRGSGRFTFSNRKQTFMRDAEGKFEIHGVTPGEYTLAARFFDPSERLGGRLSVNVGDRDLDDIRLVVRPGISLPGEIRVEGDTEVDFRELQVFLRPREVTMMGGGFGRVKEKGDFVLENVFQDVYDVSVSGAPEDFYLKAAQLGDENVLEDGLDLTAAETAPETLELLLSPNGGRVEGVVLNDEDQPFSGAQVVLVPEGRRRKMRHLFKTATSDQNGVFSLPGIAPGPYKIFAWAEIEQGAWQDNDFLRDYEKESDDFEVKENDALTVELELIPSEDGAS